MHSVLVTTDAGRLSHAFVPRLDLNRIMIILHGKSERMKETVVGFRHPFPDVVVRQMAIVTDRDMMVATCLPRVHMLLHDMTIDASIRIVAQVTRTASVSKRKCSDAHQDTDEDGKDRTSDTPSVAPDWLRRPRKAGFSRVV